MEFYKFNKEVGKQINQYRSNFVMARILQSSQSVQIGCMYLGEGGVVGYHQATLPQLFLVISGEGIVREGDSEWIHVKAGDAVFWMNGEWHETKTETGLTALVIEGEDLDPSRYMKLLENQG